MYIIETLLAVAISYFIGHGWMALIGNTPSHAVRMLRMGMEEVHGPDAEPSRGARIGVVIFWALVGTACWPADMINAARQGQLPKL